MIRVQDVGLSGVDDPVVLAWAAGEGRVLLTHDVATITGYAYERLSKGETMPGVIEVLEHTATTGSVIEDLLLLLECVTAEEIDGQIFYIPL